jgi:hypothetical protein
MDDFTRKRIREMKQYPTVSMRRSKGHVFKCRRGGDIELNKRILACTCGNDIFEEICGMPTTSSQYLFQCSSCKSVFCLGMSGIDFIRIDG